MYPVSYEADYAAEGRNRLTTLFRYFVAIPWLIVAYLYGIGSSIVATLAWFAMVFTGRYPQQLYDFNVGYLRMVNRANAFTYLMTDEYPPFGGEEAPEYPIRIGVAPALDKYSRAKAFFRYIIGIPMMFLAFVQAIILMVVTFIAWFAILFTGKHPEGLFKTARSAMAYLTRTSAYFLLITETYPPFSLEEGSGPTAGQIQTEATSRTT